MNGELQDDEDYEQVNAIKKKPIVFDPFQFCPLGNRFHETDPASKKFTKIPEFRYLPSRILYVEYLMTLTNRNPWNSYG